MPAALRARIQAVQETLVIAGATPYTAPPGGLVLTFSSAAQQRRRVQMSYRGLSEQDTERALDPYGVVFYDGRWFAVGYCHLRADLRIFRLDRVLRAELREEQFARPADFDSLAYVVRSLANAPATWSVEVLLETALEEVRECVPASMATLDPAEGGVLFRCQVQDLDWLAHFLAGLNVPLVVLRPPELRDALRRLAAQIAALAEREAVEQVIGGL
jgi:predicted DNA-binding transcriptional regulator YafY